MTSYIWVACVANNVMFNVKCCVMLLFFVVESMRFDVFPFSVIIFQHVEVNGINAVHVFGFTLLVFITWRTSTILYSM